MMRHVFKSCSNFGQTYQTEFHWHHPRTARRSHRARPAGQLCERFRLPRCLKQVLVAFIFGDSHSFEEVKQFFLWCFLPGCFQAQDPSDRSWGLWAWGNSQYPSCSQHFAGLRFYVTNMHFFSMCSWQDAPMKRPRARAAAKECGETWGNHTSSRLESVISRLSCQS